MLYLFHMLEGSRNVLERDTELLAKLAVRLVVSL